MSADATLTAMPSTLEELLLIAVRTARSGAGYRRALEDLLAEAPRVVSEELLLLMKEGRGAIVTLLTIRRGRVLFCGPALSGTAVAAAALGFDVVVLDADRQRLRFSRERARALTPEATVEFVGGASEATLPFVASSFDAVIAEDDGSTSPADFGELRRVAKAEILVVANNRLGYKRSTGRRGSFVRDPRTIVREAVKPTRGERTLVGTRASVRGDWSATRAFSLYPHAREYSHVVALDAPAPRLSIGPRERRNRIKVLAHRLGLFRLLTPSFAILAGREDLASDRLHGIVEGLASELGVPSPRIDVAIATRSNNMLLLTTPEAGRSAWAVHVPLQPCKKGMVRTHFDWLGRIREKHPDVPVPEPLFAGDVDGVYVAAARRVGGLSGTELTGDRAGTRRMIASAGAVLASLLEQEPTLVTDALFDELVQARVDLAASRARTERTAGDLRRRSDDLRRALVGRSIRLATYHADMRAKHVRVSPAGDVLALLDWGASEERFLPLADLFQLVIHQREQEISGTLGDAWRSSSQPGARRGYEREALDRYADAAGLEQADLETFVSAFPLFVAGMSEKTWDFSRPHWVARQFGL